jgi:hypothetical protein
MAGGAGCGSPGLPLGCAALGPDGADGLARLVGAAGSNGTVRRAVARIVAAEHAFLSSVCGLAPVAGSACFGPPGGGAAAASVCLPTFLGVGFEKSGSTKLFDLLSTHPDLLPSRSKEAHGFSIRADGSAETSMMRYLEEQYAWRGRSQGLPVALGEFTPGYAETWRCEQTPPSVRRSAAAASSRNNPADDAALRSMPRLIAQLRVQLLLPPSALFLVSMREPVDRAWSSYKYHIHSPDCWRRGAGRCLPSGAGFGVAVCHAAAVLGGKSFFEATQGRLLRERGEVPQRGERLLREGGGPPQRREAWDTARSGGGGTRARGGAVGSGGGAPGAAGGGPGGGVGIGDSSTEPHTDAPWCPVYTAARLRPDHASFRPSSSVPDSSILRLDFVAPDVSSPNYVNPHADFVTPRNGFVPPRNGFITPQSGSIPPAMFAHWDIITPGLYYDNLAQWVRRFGHGRFVFLEMRDLGSSEIMALLFARLGLPPHAFGEAELREPSNTQRGAVGGEGWAGVGRGGAEGSSRGSGGEEGAWGDGRSGDGSGGGGIVGGIASSLPAAAHEGSAAAFRLLEEFYPRSNQLTFGLTGVGEGWPRAGEGTGRAAAAADRLARLFHSACRKCQVNQTTGMTRRC